jgi:hypothetical protein
MGFGDLTAPWISDGEEIAGNMPVAKNMSPSPSVSAPDSRRSGQRAASQQVRVPRIDVVRVVA